MQKKFKMQGYEPSFQKNQIWIGVASVLMAMLTTNSSANETQMMAGKVSMQPITVYAERQQNVAESLTTISRENLDQTNTTDMADIVKYLPLVSAPFNTFGGSTYFNGSGTSGYNIRGVAANRIGLDVDGVDLAEATVSSYMPPKSMNQRGAGRDYIEPEMFSSVDIASGTTGANQDGIGGRVSFKNKSPEDYLNSDKQMAGTFKNGYSSADNAWLSSVTAAVGNDVVQGLVAYAHRDGHETEAHSNTKAFPADWTSDAVLTKLLWNISDTQQLNFTFDHYKKDLETKNIASNVFTTFKSDADQKQRLERQLFSLEHIYTPTELAAFDQLKTKIWTQKTNNETDTSFMNSPTVKRDFLVSNKEKNTGIKLDAQKALAQHALKFGITADQKKYDSSKVDARNGVPSATVYQGGYLLASDLTRYSAYISDTFTTDLFGRELKLTPSLRAERQEFRPETTAYEDIQARDFNYLSPSFTASYQITPENYSYFKYARGNRIPSPTEMGGIYQTSTQQVGYIVVGNSNLEKESSDAFELGFKSTAIDGLKFDVTAFYTKYHDFIDYAYYDDHPKFPYGFYRAENIANANIWGAEVSARVDLGEFVPHSEGFSIALVAGKTKGTATDKDGKKTGVNSVQPEKGSLTFAYDEPNKKYGFGLTATAVGSKSATRDASTLQQTGEESKYQPVAGYSVWDLSAYWKLHKNAKLNVSMNNVFDKTYWNYASVGTLIGDDQASLIDRAAESGRNIVASIEFKH